MKAFIVKIILLCGIISTSILGLYTYWFSHSETIIYIKKKNIIIGDSNTRWSMDDKILSSYANYSTGGEIYAFAYRKLKIINKNNRIDTLLLSFNPHNLINNEWWNDQLSTPLNNRMPAFYMDFSREEHWDFLQNMPKNYLRSMLKIGNSKLLGIFNTYHKDFSQSMDKFGFYLPNAENETQRKFEPYPYKKPIIAEMELKYLHKIISECKAKNIHIILIQPPKNYLRKDYKNYNHKEFYEVYQHHFSDIDFLDFAQLELPPHAYWDMNHVDIVGAEYFSNFLQKEGIKRLLHSKFNKKIK